MPIESSVIIKDRSQVDGRRHVREKHTDHLGVEHFVSYMAEENEDEQANLTARAAQIEAQLAEQELAANEAEALGEE